MNMMTSENGSTCRFENPAEQLVLFGYRNWSYGYSHHSEIHIAQSWAIHTKHLGNISQAKEVLDALILFTQALSDCATCPLKSQPNTSHWLTKEEGLILGLISSIQNGDEQVCQTCLEHLTCKSRCWELAHAAERYAVTLRSLDRTLQPIPIGFIKQLIIPSSPLTLH
jgi:hypothetical protein